MCRAYAVELSGHVAPVAHVRIGSYMKFDGGVTVTNMSKAMSARRQVRSSANQDGIVSM
jgi:hypothetical protein